MYVVVEFRGQHCGVRPLLPPLCVFWGLNSGHYVCMTNAELAELPLLPWPPSTTNFYQVRMSSTLPWKAPLLDRKPHLHKTHAGWRVWAKSRSETLTFWGLAAAMKERGCPSLTVPPGNQKQHGWHSLKWGEPMFGTKTIEGENIHLSQTHWGFFLLLFLYNLVQQPFTWLCSSHATNDDKLWGWIWEKPTRILSAVLAPGWHPSPNWASVQPEDHAILMAS